MCTNFVLIKNNGVAKLSNKLRFDPDALIYSDFKPGAKISVVREKDKTRLVNEAVLWLFLTQTEHGLKPHPDYFSVNTNWAKLPKRPEYRKSRCIIPGTAFIESQEGKRPHILEPADGSAIAFGGLYKEWLDKTTGEIIYSASIITLPGHPLLENIHKKSTPLWLPEDQFDAWLDPENTDTECFNELLKPAIRTPLLATPIDKVMSKKPIGVGFIVGHEMG